jgi:hypothetical protein
MDFSSVTNSHQLAQLLSEAQAGQPQSLFMAANGGHDTVINRKRVFALTINLGEQLHHRLDRP